MGNVWFSANLRAMIRFTDSPVTVRYRWSFRRAGEPTLYSAENSLAIDGAGPGTREVWLDSPIKAGMFEVRLEILGPVATQSQPMFAVCPA